MRANTCYESTKEPRKWNDKGDPNREISRNWNQAEEQVIRRMKDRRNKAKKNHFPNQARWKKKKLKAKYLQNSNGGPLILQKSRGVVGVPTNGNMLGDPVISICIPED